jgi:2,4-dienoyl-CoA reductase-like NADH-dependent reductase (Old Yellow Enzyme family)
MFSEFKLKDKIILRNKAVLAPMTTWSSNTDLTVADDEAKYYAARSKGPGMVITGTTFFQKNGQGFANQFYAGSDEFIPSLKKLADSIKAGGAKAILQIFHGGRMADPRFGLVSASAVKPTHNLFGPVDDMPTPRELTNQETWDLVDGFYESIRRAIQAGFDGVEIHGANTYLIQQFFSPHSNRRDDEWGGNIEKRMKFPLEIIKAAAKAKNKFADEKFIIGYRFSPEEMENPGITLKDTLYLVDTLSNIEDLDYLSISLPHFAKTSIRDDKDKRPIGKVISEKIAKRKPFIGAGGISSQKDVHDALYEIGYDLIAIGHSMITDPRWVEKIERGEQIDNVVHMKKLEEQIIPMKLAETIKNIPGWFNVEE